MNQLLVKTPLQLWIPDAYRQHLEDDVWSTYTLVAKHERNWQLGVPLEGPFKDYLEGEFQKFASWSYTGDREAYLNDVSKDVDEWTQNAYQAFGESYYEDVGKLLRYFRLSFHWDFEGYQYMPWKEIW